MTQSEHRPPSEQRRAIREARDQLQPSPAFAARLDIALAQGSATRPPRRLLSVLRRWTELPLVLSASLSVAVAVCVCWDTPVFDDFRVAEHSLEIPVDGSALVPLELALHHHGEERAEIAVNAPVGVSVSTHVGGDVEPHLCKANRCSYALTDHGLDDTPAMHVKVHRPGRYRMEIEHRSSSAAVREIFVIHARR